mgnify:CR=1 FL=1
MDGAEDAPPNAFYVKAQFSLLAPGALVRRAGVRPHVDAGRHRRQLRLQRRERRRRAVIGEEREEKTDRM